MYGFQGNQWQFGRISLRDNVEQAINQPYQLVVEAIVGKSIQGDISIDDLAVNQGPCPVSSKINLSIKYFHLVNFVYRRLRFRKR